MFENTPNRMRALCARLLLTGFLSIGTAGFLAGCDDNDIDDLDDVGDEIEDAVEDVGDEIEDAFD